jgi:phosphate transport system permease protein
MTDEKAAAAERHLRRRYAAERRFRLYGQASILVALGALALLLTSIVSSGWSGFFRHVVELDVAFDPSVLGIGEQRDADALAQGDYGALVKSALQEQFPDVTERRARRDLAELVSTGASEVLRKLVADDPARIGSRALVEVPVADDADMFYKGNISRDVAEGDRRLSDQQLGWLEALDRAGRVHLEFNGSFLTGGDSREAELAGVGGAVMGSLLTLAIAVLLSFPVGVAAAVYLEEFAPRNRWTDLIEVNINNLAAVPSIVFGLLGLAVFLNFFGLPRSAPVVGGLVLALMTLPVIIIAGRAAIAAVPPSIRQAAMGLGASPVETVFHHVLPLALPGILTGTILGLARALGETAPLLMIGMVAFIVDVPGTFTSPATVLPVQIYLWADSPERAFVEKTSAAIMVLLAFLVAMNSLAIVLRRRFERRW